MKRLLSYPLLLPLLAFAQDKAAEAPVEKASPAVVIAFVAIFIGACIAYLVYAVISTKKDKAKEK
jgi:hypothetical protein